MSFPNKFERCHNLKKKSLVTKRENRIYILYLYIVLKFYVKYPSKKTSLKMATTVGQNM